MTEWRGVVVKEFRWSPPVKGVTVTRSEERESEGGRGGEGGEGGKEEEEKEEKEGENRSDSVR